MLEAIAAIVLAVGIIGGTNAVVNDKSGTVEVGEITIIEENK